jgi:four helix bundle protein
MTKSQDQNPNKVQSPKLEKTYDLPERSAAFGEAAIRFARSLPRDVIMSPLLSQVVRSSTSIGANYAEADGAESRKDFKHRIAICKREARETMHWMRMLASACPESADACRRLWQEAHELLLIFSTIYLK